MSAALDKRLAKVEAISVRSEIGEPLDRLLQQAGTTRAAMMEKHGTLWAFRDWLAAQPPGDIVL